MGSFSVLNNPSAINGQNQLNINNISLNRTMQRMASGLRINTGADDAAGLQIADSLRANVQALNQGVRNANDGISYLQIADGSLAEITNILTRMVTLASQAATETNDQMGRNALNNEFQTIQEEIARIARDTNFNGSQVFDRGRTFLETLDLFVGDLSYDSYISVNIGFVDVAKTAFKDENGNFTNSENALEFAYKAATLAGLVNDPDPSNTATTAGDPVAKDIEEIYDAVQAYKAFIATPGSATEAQITEAKDAIAKFEALWDGKDKVMGFGAPSENENDFPRKPDYDVLTDDGFLAKLGVANLLSRKSAEDAFKHIKASLNEIAVMRGDIGAGMNRLQASVSVMQTQSRNTLSAESAIRDANMAEEISNLTKYQILAQTGIAALAHSNSNSQTVLRLLQ